MSFRPFGSLRGYRGEWLSGDAIAGLTVWAVLVPEALAYATIAGAPPVVGLYAAPGALILYAVFGSSRHLITGPMSATAALSAAVVAQFATAGSSQFVTLTAALAITAGVIAVIAGLLRLGFVANFISEPVLKGFIIGLALTIIAGQLPKLFGVEGGSGNFFEKVWDLIRNLGETHWRTLAVGLVSLAIVVGFRRFLPVIPGSLVAVAFGVGVVYAFDLDKHGVEIVGNIDGGLPSLGLPDIRAKQYLELAGSSIGIVLIGFAEGLGAAKTYAAQHHYEIDANSELLGLGAANLGAGLSSGMVVNGSLSKTAVNGGAGAKSQVSGLIVAGLTIVTLLFLTGLFEKLPEPTLAAVVIAAVVELVDIAALRRLRRVVVRGQRLGIAARPDFVAALAAMLGVLVFDTLPGLVIGISCSLVLLVYRASRPHISELGKTPGDPHRWSDLERNPDDARVPGIVVMRVEAGLFFANADHVREAVRKAAATDGTRAVVLDAETVAFIDVTAADMLTTLTEELAAEGVVLAVAHDVGQVRDTLSETGAANAIGRNTYATVDEAIEALAQVDPRHG
jgi:high affinity sulfate transporter 1